MKRSEDNKGNHIIYLVSNTAEDKRTKLNGILKGKSNQRIFDKHANLKYQNENREFWRPEYYVDTIGKNKKVNSKIYAQSTERRFSVWTDEHKIIGWLVYRGTGLGK